PCCSRAISSRAHRGCTRPSPWATTVFPSASSTRRWRCSPRCSSEAADCCSRTIPRWRPRAWSRTSGGASPPRSARAGSWLRLCEARHVPRGGPQKRGASRLLLRAAVGLAVLSVVFLLDFLAVTFLAEAFFFAVFFLVFLAAGLAVVAFF